MSSPGDDDAAAAAAAPSAPSPAPSDGCEATLGSTITVTVGATVPTGFEHTAAEEVKEKIGAAVRIGKDRGRIYFEISTDKLFQVGTTSPDGVKYRFSLSARC